jgi:hypothetical protein
MGQIGFQTIDYSRGSRALAFRSLSGDRLLGFLLDGDLAAIAFCDTCDGAIDLRRAPREPTPCLCEGGMYQLVSEAELRKWSERIRRACSRDRQLLPRAKALFRQKHGEDCVPTFKEPFAWLTTAWEGAGSPWGRRFALHLYLQVVGYIEEFWRNGVSYGALADLIETRDNPLDAEVVWERIKRCWKAGDLRAEQRLGIKRLPEGQWQALVDRRRRKLEAQIGYLLDDREWPAGTPPAVCAAWRRHRQEMFAILRRPEEISRVMSFARDYFADPWKRPGDLQIRPGRSRSPRRKRLA